MPATDDIRWFKAELGPRIDAALAGTPFTLDFMTALACQETGEVWPALRRDGLSTDEVLALCVGDTLDGDRGRAAFPRTKADLLARPQGAQMFAIAHQALVEMARHVRAYAGAAARPDKFCHGFGLFQRDLQFFLDDPDYFLQHRYEQLEGTLAQALGELRRALKKLGLDDRPSLSDLELAAVGIAYNTGGYKPAKGLKQGYFDGTRYYGESLFDYLRQAHAVPADGQAPAVVAAPAGQATLRPPTPATSAGQRMRVAVSEGMLRVRSEPVLSQPPQKNVIGHLPDGHVVHVLSQKAKNGFVEVETNLLGALLHGYAVKKYLRPAEADAVIPVIEPQALALASGITAVYAPRTPGTVTRRRDAANALSLNEPNQPARAGTSAEELRQALAAIVEWLDVQDPSHRRYQPHDGLTFCNIYAHDYCHLAGAYLPRVWWSATALVQLAQGQAVAPRLGATIGEVVANELFAWLRDFGPAFGWRQTGTLTKLQTEVDQGAVGVVVARRREGGRPGHISMVVPEIGDHSARRNAAGDVVAPLQSQAGATNFRYRTGTTNWWLGEQFAEFAFWLHA